MATQIELLRHAAEEATGAYSAEMAKYHDDNLPNAEQAAHIDTLRVAMTDSVKAVKAAEDHLRNAAQWNAQQEAMGRANGSHPKPADATPQSQGQRQSLGQRFVESDSYREMMARIAPAGRVLEKVNIQSDPITFKGYEELRQNAALVTGSSSTSGGAFVLNDRYGQLTEYGRRPLTIRDIITNLTTNSDLVEYVKQTSETNAAAVVAEATATSGSSGVKPESDMAFEVATTPVVTIAHWMAVTRQALGDAGQLQGLINEFLKAGLDEEAEDYIVNAATYGILNTSGTQAQAWDTNMVKTLRVAKRKVRTVGRRIPTHYVLNPEDWETIDLLQDNNARYLGQGPFGLTSPILWGLPVIESEAVPVGTGLVGDFKACVAWDREEGSITTSNSHADFFIRNLVAILAELRMAFAVIKPNAIVEVDLTA